MDPVLAQLCSQAPASLQPLFPRLNELYQGKLWHELTMALDELYRQPESACLQLPLLEQFILGRWDLQMRPASLLALTISASRQVKTAEAAAALLEGMAGRLEARQRAPSTAPGLAAQLAPLVAWARLEQAHWLLRAGLGQAGVKRVRVLVGEAQGQLAQQAQPEPSLVRAYYRVQTDLAKAVASFAEHYRQGLLYVAACWGEEKGNDLIPDVAERAHDLALSALLAPDAIFNFGELLGHPGLLPHLPPNLHALLTALQSGDDLERIQTQLLPAACQAYPILAAHAPQLQEKAALMALMATAALHPRNQPLSFASLSQLISAGGGRGGVEMLLIKAFSLGLLRGHLDGVAEVVHLSWVQPRLLSHPAQFKALAMSLQAQQVRVEAASTLLTQLLPELTS